MTHHRLLALAALAALVGCSGDKLLGPPDAPACTRGGLVAGQTVTGTLSRSSCPVFSEWEFQSEYYESWTMPVQAGHAYLLHLVPDTTAAGDSTNANILLYSRNAVNDPVMVTASTYYDNALLNTNGMRAQVIFFVAPENAAVSVRVETGGQPADTLELGGYALTATECAAAPILTNDSATATASYTASACVLHRTTDSVRMFFYPFQGILNHQYSASLISDSGTASLEVNVAGPSWDAQCEVRDDCDWESNSVVDSGAVGYTPAVSGQFEAFAFIGDDGTSGAFHMRLDDFGPAPVAPMSVPYAHTRRRVAR